MKDKQTSGWTRCKTGHSSGEHSRYKDLEASESTRVQRARCRLFEEAGAWLEGRAVRKPRKLAEGGSGDGTTERTVCFANLKV